MPLVNITLQKGKDKQRIKKISQTIHDVLIETWNIPSNDYFHIINAVDPDCFFIDKTMWDMERTDDVIVIHITSMPRTQSMKLSFYEKLPRALELAVGLKPDNVFISIVTNQAEDWTFGKGVSHP
jgi:phenylpyruvate tautomerase PptA (4-oxalocrotonate tautomerase family)